jgi:hypothetical protein
MLGRGRSQVGATGELLLVASIVTLVPSWVGGVQLLSAIGLGNVPAAVVGGAYAWGRGGLSAAILLRRWRQGTLVLGRSWLLDALETAAARSRLADYPTPTPARCSLSAGGPVAV